MMETTGQNRNRPHRLFLTMAAVMLMTVHAQAGQRYGATITVEPPVICVGCTATVTVNAPTGDTWCGHIDAPSNVCFADGTTCKTNQACPVIQQCVETIGSPPGNCTGCPSCGPTCQQVGGNGTTQFTIKGLSPGQGTISGYGNRYVYGPPNEGQTLPNSEYCAAEGGHDWWEDCADVTVVGASLSVSPTSGCEDSLFTFTAVTDPPDQCDCVKWLDFGGGTVQSAPDGCKRKVSWDTCGSPRRVWIGYAPCLTDPQPPFDPQNPPPFTAFATIGVDCDKLIGPDPNDLWYFGIHTGGYNNAPGNYAVSAAFTWRDADIGTFDWTVSNEACIVNPNTPSQCVGSITLTDHSIVIVKTRLWNADWLGAKMTCTWTHPSGTPTLTCTKNFNVFAPSTLERFTPPGTPPDLAYPTGTDMGYESKIHYKIKDQFGTILPRDVPWNEKFNAVPVSDWAGENWGWGDQNGWVVNPNDAFDTITRSAVPGVLTPDPRAPYNGAGKIDHVPGTWRVGSADIGEGLQVKDVVWQIYQDHGNHE